MPPCRIIPAMIPLIIALAAPMALAQNRDCTRTSIGLTPLMDLGMGAYFGFEGGLYSGGENVPPSDHFLAGLERGRSIVPLDPTGQPSPNGSVVLLSIGMSNTHQEFAPFIQVTNDFVNRNPRLTLVNGAMGGQHAGIIRNPNAEYWDRVDGRLSLAGITPEQVQVVWLKQAVAGPSGGFPAHATLLRGYLEEIARILHDRFPNLKQCYLSSRTYAYYGLGNLNPEPYAFQSGFSVKWLIEDQIAGLPGLNYSPAQGPVVAPWLAWSAYLWADGLTPRSDGFQWACDDAAADGIHPSAQGAAKIAGLLLDAFSRDPTSRPWFVRCEADIDDNGLRDIFDFLEFQNLFAAADPLACDCDVSTGARVCDIFDFLCFQNLFAHACD